MAKKKTLDFTAFWDDSDYYTNPIPATDDMMDKTEKKLGYRLPRSYRELLKSRNGGLPLNTCYPTKTPTSWAEDHIEISGIFGVGFTKGIDNNRFWIEEWGYPDIGIAVCDCPSAGHDMVMLDYRKKGPEGEPEVVHVEVECDEPEITFLAPDFAAFIAGLVDSAEFDGDPAEAKMRALTFVKTAAFSPALSSMCGGSSDLEKKIRILAEQIVEKKGFFSLHDDPLSYFMYDILFWLYTESAQVKDADEFMKGYETFIALADGFSTGGYAPDFITGWFELRVKEKKIEKKHSGCYFTSDYQDAIKEKILSLH